MRTGNSRLTRFITSRTHMAVVASAVLFVGAITFTWFTE